MGSPLAFLFSARQIEVAACELRDAKAFKILSILVSVHFLYLASIATAQAESNEQSIESEIEAFDAVWSQLNNFELCFTSRRTVSTEAKVISTQQRIIFSKPFFSCEVTCYENDVIIDKYKYTFDGKRYYCLQNNHRLTLFSNISGAFLYGLISSPLTLPWLPLLYRNPELTPQFMGTAKAGNSIISGSSLSKSSTGELAASDNGSITAFYSSKEQGKFPQWKKTTKDGGTVEMKIVATTDSPLMPGELIPKKIEVLDHIVKSGAVITTVTELTKLVPVTGLRPSDFVIMPNEADVIWDDDLKVLLKSGK